MLLPRDPALSSSRFSWHAAAHGAQQHAAVDGGGWDGSDAELPMQKATEIATAEEQRRGETDGEHRDIVFLAEGFRHGSDLCGGTAAEVTSTFEAEELAARVAGFEDAIGEKSEIVLGIKAEDGLGVLRRAVDAEREAGFNGNLDAIDIRRQMASIGEHDFPVRGYARTQASDEAGFLGFEQLLV